MPSSIKELAPGGCISPYRICRELLCLNVNGSGVCVSVGLCAYPWGCVRIRGVVCMPDRLSMSSSIQ